MKLKLTNIRFLLLLKKVVANWIYVLFFILIPVTSLSCYHHDFDYKTQITYEDVLNYSKVVVYKIENFPNRTILYAYKLQRGSNRFYDFKHRLNILKDSTVIQSFDGGKMPIVVSSTLEPVANYDGRIYRPDVKNLTPNTEYSLQSEYYNDIYSFKVIDYTWTTEN